MEAYEKLMNCFEALRAETDFVPQVALVLGSGLGDFASRVEAQAVVDYGKLRAFPLSTVAGHKGRFIFGTLGGVPIAVMQGRVHYYEGYSMEDVVLPIRLLGLMGAKALFLTNAAGGVNFSFTPGDLMLIRDHISTFVPSPLRGKNIEELGPRFPAMNDVYDPGLCGTVRRCAEENHILLKEGTYIQLPGPQYETPAEIRMCRSLGADAVGMSTVCEAIAARHMGMKVCGVSCITNMAAGMVHTPPSHKEVAETAGRVAESFAALISGAITSIK